MASKISVIFGFIAFAGVSGQYYDSGDYYHQDPVVEESYQEDPHSHPKYSFHYDIRDDHTGDIKSQKETRDGDHVQGEYSLIDADGYKRIVKYSDDGHGFNVQVIREPTKYQIPQPVQKYVNAPAISNYATPDPHHASQNDHYSHVSFNGHGSSYNY